MSGAGHVFKAGEKRNKPPGTKKSVFARRQNLRFMQKVFLPWRREANSRGKKCAPQYGAAKGEKEESGG